MIAVGKKIKETTRYTNLAILAFKWQIQIVAIYSPYLYIQYFQFRLRLKTSIINNKMAILWITISPTNWWNLVVIYLIGFELDVRSDVAFVFARKIAIITLETVAKFFYIIYKKVLLSLFARRCCNEALLRLLLMYFGTIETNGHNIFYLYCLVWLNEKLYLPILCTKI